MGQSQAVISCPSSIPHTYDPDSMIDSARLAFMCLLDAASRAVDELDGKEASQVNYAYVFGQLAQVQTFKADAITHLNHACNLVDQADPDEDEDDEDDEVDTPLVEPPYQLAEGGAA